MPTPPPSPLISLSPPSIGERLAMSSTQDLVDAVTTALPSPPLLPLPPSLYIPPPVDRRDDIPESERPPRKRSCLFSLGPSTLDAEERRRGIREVRYGIRDTWVDPAEAVPEIAPMTVGEDSRTRILQRVTMDSQWVDLLMEDRIAYQETLLIIEEEAYASQEAYAHAIGLTPCASDTATVAGYSYSDTTPVETLRVMRNMRREMGDMQAELLALREQQRRARQPGPDVKVPYHQDASRDADSHI
ncbi:hypothetical protein Tco_0549374 [Tanacetum coccineum]